MDKTLYKYPTRVSSQVRHSPRQPAYRHQNAHNVSGYRTNVQITESNARKAVRQPVAEHFVRRTGDSLLRTEHTR